MVAYGITKETIEIFRKKEAKYFVTTTKAVEVIGNSVINDIKKEYEAIRSTNEYLIVKL